jgi:hypothetical protein
VTGALAGLPALAAIYLALDLMGLVQVRETVRGLVARYTGRKGT